MEIKGRTYISFIFLQALTSILFAALPLSSNADEERQILISVTDTDGNPLPNASVSIEYSLIKNLFKNRTPEIIKALSDQNGTVDATALNISVSGVAVSKQGYYSSWLPGKRSEEDQVYVVAMKKILNPTPLYAKIIDLKYPDVGNRKVGFDFFIGDWVVPFGKGTVSDLIFEVVDGEATDEALNLSNRQHMKVVFPKVGDGIHAYPLDYQPQESDFQFPYLAPESDYSTELYFELPEIRIQPGITPPPVYPFAFSRIRSEINPNSGSYSGYYLKLYPSFQISEPFSIFRQVQFTYYLNKERNNRNLEFDPETNLSDMDTGVNNLNLMEKNSYSRTFLDQKRTINFHKQIHYRTVDEIKAALLADKVRKSAPSKVVFTTEGEWTGNLGGIEGANQKCQSEANKNPALTGKRFSAWITSLEAHPPTENPNFHKSAMRYATVDGETVVANFNSLISNDRYTHIGMTASGLKISDTSAWTNVTSSGNIDSTKNHCQNWRSASPTDKGHFGVLSYPLRNNCATFKSDCTAWTTKTRNSHKNSNEEQGCSAKRRLYCFEQ